MTWDPRVDPWQIDESEFYEVESATEQLRFLLRYAVLAPSGHNTQPWTFHVASDAIEVVTIPVTRVAGSPAFSVSTESGFHSTPMFVLMRSISWSAVIACAADNFPAPERGAAAASAASAANSRLEMSAIVVASDQCTAAAGRAAPGFSTRGSPSSAK